MGPEMDGMMASMIALAVVCLLIFALNSGKRRVGRASAGDSSFVAIDSGGQGGHSGWFSGGSGADHSGNCSADGSSSDAGCGGDGGGGGSD
jgi:hypothetical protein